MHDIVLIGLNHKTASVDVRECIAFTPDETERALVALRDHTAISESVLFSTCNRIELLMTAAESQAAVSAAKQFFADFKNVPLSDFESALYHYTGDEAVRHTFQVAASLDSMVVGEPQILGQMKEAYRKATLEKTSGVILNKLLHRTFFVAKKVRTETGIGDHAVSISYAAIELGRKIFGDLTGKRVMLIGAGEMAELAVEHFDAQPRRCQSTVANRNLCPGCRVGRTFFQARPSNSKRYWTPSRTLTLSSVPPVPPTMCCAKARSKTP